MKKMKFLFAVALSSCFVSCSSGATEETNGTGSSSGEVAAEQTGPPSSENVNIPDDISLFDLLGVSTDAPEAQRFLSGLGPVEEENGIPAYPHWMYFEAGVEVVVDKENSTIHAIFLMGPGDKWYAAYPGALPLGILWSDTREQVEQKIGSGTKRSFGDDVVMQHKDKQLEINYASTDYTDMNAVLRSIQVRTFN